MKRFITIVAMLCLLGSVAVAQQTIKQKVAVYVTGDVESGYKKVIGSKLVTGITRSEGYAAIERTADFLAELNKEQDYQMSGAVSDNQIARLGQQFGVRYVLVADISEVFESMFISARIIDVQTAQITNSTEASDVVNNMESLTKLSESIVLRLFYVTNFSKDDVKILGPFSDARALCEINKGIPGYHSGSREEIEKVIKNNQILNIATKVPIYTDIQSKYLIENQFFKVYYYKNNSTTNVVDTDNESRPYGKRIITYTSINGINDSSTKSTYYCDNFEYDIQYSIWNKPATSQKWKCVSSGLTDMEYNEYITPGYVYFFKNE